MTDRAVKLTKTRGAVVADIQRLVEPHLRDSGYRRYLDPSKGLFGGTRPLRLWAPDNPIELDGFALAEVLAVTEDGLLEDASGGGAVQGDWGCYPVEDLCALRDEVRRILAGRRALEPSHD